MCVRKKNLQEEYTIWYSEFKSYGVMKTFITLARKVQRYKANLNKNIAVKSLYKTYNSERTLVREL